MFIVFPLLLSACATDPNQTWFEGAAMSYKVTDIGNGRYSLVAQGAGAHKPEQVERAFLFRAGQLCNGGAYQHEVKLQQYQYSAPSGVIGGSTYHRATEALGTVVCSK